MVEHLYHPSFKFLNCLGPRVPNIHDAKNDTFVSEPLQGSQVRRSMGSFDRNLVNPGARKQGGQVRIAIRLGLVIAFDRLTAAGVASLVIGQIASPGHELAV